jgi:hypothetical protein
MQGQGLTVLAVILSMIGFYWYFVEPVRTISTYPSEIPYFIIFIAFVVLLSWFGVIRRRVEADLRQSRDALREHASLLSSLTQKPIRRSKARTAPPSSSESNTPLFCPGSTSGDSRNRKLRLPELELMAAMQTLGCDD